MCELLQLTISDEETLRQAEDHLHDGFIDPSTVVFDPGISAFSLVMWRVIGSHQLLRIFNVPDNWARCRFTVRQVGRAEVIVEDKGLWPVFIAFTYRPGSGTLEFELAMAMKIRVHIRSLDGELTDIGDTSRNPTKWTKSPATGAEP